MNDSQFTAQQPVELILEKYANMVYRIAFSRTKNKADADDILQEVFLRYIRSGTQFETDEHAKAWLIRTTINCSINLLCSAWFRKTTTLDENLIVEVKENSEVYYAVLALSEKYRIVIHLYYYEDLSISQISAILNKKESTIKSLLHRARSLLKLKLEGEYKYV